MVVYGDLNNPKLPGEEETFMLDFTNINSDYKDRSLLA